jgi:thiamine kinase-like enzyme
MEWGEQRATRAAHKACELYGLDEPALLRISHAAVYAAGDHIVRVEQKGRPVWSGGALVALTRYLASRGIQTAPPVFDLLPLFIDDLHVTFYRRIIDQTPMEETQKAFLLGEQLRVLHERVSVEHVAALNMDDINLDYPSATVERTVRSLNKIRELGLRSLTVEDVDYLLEKTKDLGERALVSLEEYRKTNASEFVVIHGDPNLGNVLSVGDEIVLLDFEHAAIAENFFDHIHILLLDLVFEGSNLYPSFAQGYGTSFDDFPDKDAWVHLVAVSYLTWTASVGEHSEPHRIEAQKRMKWWRGDSDAPPFWTEGF